MLTACGRERASVATPVTDAPRVSVTPTDVRAPATPTPATPTPAPDSIIPAPQDAEDLRAAIPALATRIAAFEAVIAGGTPVLPLPEASLDAQQRAAQQVALAEPAFTQYTRALVDGSPLRSEVFSVQPLRPDSITAATQACTGSATCYRVELYNYALNLTSTAVVNVGEGTANAGTVLDVQHLQDVQPELPPALAELAAQIALRAPETAAELGTTPADATMANVKTALNNSACEDSKHLCVAPTFLVGDRALWAIVDLTDHQLVGLRWTALGDFSAGRPTQELVEMEEIFDTYCDTINTLERDGWRLDYVLTGSDGLRVSDVTFEGAPVLDSAKVMDFHVSYSTREGFGYSDAVGCPAFSSSAVVASGPPVVEALDGTPAGFALTQNYRHPLWPAPCNYHYAQRFEFYTDGSFRVVVTNLGRGCGNDGTYRPILRIDPAGADQSIAQWNGAAWQPWTTEQWLALDDATLTDDGYLFQLSNGDGTGYFVEPGTGQFPDERGDHALIYVTRAQPGEGDTDLPTLGTCCNTDHRQGPIQFVEPDPEPLDGAELVLWYVPQIENDDTPGQEYCWADVTVEDGLFVPQVWPCSAGPRFVPVE